jgi:hypothetical protein
MKKFIKSAFGDPFLVDANDFNPGFFGHLNALVEAITALEQGSGGPGGGNNISVFLNNAPKVTTLNKLNFSGNVTITEGVAGEALITIPTIANYSIARAKLAQMPQGLIGRYSAGSGPVEDIVLGTGFQFVGNTLNATAVAQTLQGTLNQIGVSTASNVSTFSLLAPVANSGTLYTLPTIKVDASGRITSAISGSIDQVTLTSTSASTITRTPTSANDIANKAYVDNFAQGLKPKASARLATTGTNISLNGLQTIDGVPVAVGNRILVKNQTAAANNGVWIVVVGGPWTRADDYNSAAEAADGSFVFVREGTTNAGSGFVQITSVTTFGTDPITFAQFSAGGTYTAGAGLGLSGNQFKLNDTAVQVGSYGTASNVPAIQIDAQGRITSATSTQIVINLLSSGATANIAVGSLLGAANGGTGFATYAKGDILYAATAGPALSKLTIGSTDKVLTVKSGVPSWEDAAGGLTNPMSAKGQMIYASAGSGAVGSGTPAILPVSTTDGFVLTYNTSSNVPEWKAPQGSNPTSTIGDIIYTSTTASPGTLARLPIGATGQYLRVNNTGGVLLPKWENGVTTGTVISFVVDGYGGPIVSSGGSVFVVQIPFTAAYTKLFVSTSGALDLPGAGQRITLAVGLPGGTQSIFVENSEFTKNITLTPSTISGTPTTPTTLTFAVTTTASCAVTKLFVSLTGTRS